MPLALTVTNEQQVGVVLNPVTLTGRPAEIQAGSVKLTVQTGDSTGAPTTENEKRLVLVSSDTPGDTVYLVEADADMGEGVETIADLITLTVQGARAASLGLVPEEPTPKPVA